jgi:hypothetical protein
LLRLLSALDTAVDEIPEYTTEILVLIPYNPTNVTISK